ncbi:KaiC family protein [Chitinophaga agrisoli]|uniref:non-specific serine/threonine protein kinase n=1 Tax=Chitinophaga agrisoli TaxID=2607653 RepID=A0A5B2VWB1_9BACT|nr:circadian clock protein KaiC [Chitinophaga agrisoli]KAA2243601.1 KaiC family protein [Chitinophaga agrisoli]
MAHQINNDVVLQERVLKKVQTGISGLDEITGGGIPAGRPTLVCGGPGSGKTLLSTEFIVRGITEFNEPGVFVTFEEKTEELTTNVASLGFDLQGLQSAGLLKIDHVHVDRDEIQETGEYDLEGLFIRLGHAIDTIGAKRVVLDTVESLFSGLQDRFILRAELKRLFQWLKEKQVTAIVTAEKGVDTLTREGLEEYVSDCVILLDQRVTDKIATRLLRIVKYRGSVHGTNEYPFLIDEEGLAVLPVTSLKLENTVAQERVPSGIPSLDKMLGGNGFFKGSSILVSGTSGTGKTSIAACFANEACSRGESCIYFAFEESPPQIIRNMRSIGIDLEPHVKSGLLHIHASRPTLYGLEMHLVTIHKMVKTRKPSTVIIDPVSNLTTVGTVSEVKSMLTRLMDFFQNEGITVLMTALNTPDRELDQSISSLVDTWLLLKDMETNGERNRGMYIMKSRGMKHSNQVREFVITDKGLELVDVYMGPEGILTGSARVAQQLQEETEKVLRAQAASRKEMVVERRRRVLEAKIAGLREEFESMQEELNRTYTEEDLKSEIQKDNRSRLARNRHS